MSDGYYNLQFEFGNCIENKNYSYTELRQAMEEMKFGKVLSWTLATGQERYADRLLLLGVHGLIYGFKAAHYDHGDKRAAIRAIKAWVDKHSDTHRIANKEDVS
ncbi:hypothetical protein BDV25DRAFT_137582 [Aspergillus avenaceus]|uniref:Uncharacterized protein n=1 Tax=Aspergillus avenaceus TaxID=36643 RepID=A0A5N6U2E7_ASPAV|nr:hypothetical protein BDV25DRAFT_137582 [Aspergillus avenaceus]